MLKRDRLTRMMILNKIVFEKERRQVIEDLCSFASQDCTILYRSEEKSVENVYSVKDCVMKMMKYNS